MLREVLLLLAGQAIGATSVVFIRISGLDAALLAAMRLLLGAGILGSVGLLSDIRRRSPSDAGAENGISSAETSDGGPTGPLRGSGSQGPGLLAGISLKRSLAPGILMGLHLFTWNIGARATLAANATLVVNMVPIAMPIVVYVLYRERLNRGQIVATLLAVSGIVVLASGSMRIGMETLLGDLVNVLSLFLLAGYLALARRQRQGQSLFAYVVPLYFVGGSLALVLALLSGADFRPLANLTAWLPAIGLAVGPTAVGHTIFNRAMGTVPSQTVSLFIVTQFVFAGVYAAIIFRELPFPAFYPAAAMVLAGVGLDLRAGRKAAIAARGANP